MNLYRWGPASLAEACLFMSGWQPLCHWRQCPLSTKEGLLMRWTSLWCPLEVKGSQEERPCYSSSTSTSDCHAQQRWAHRVLAVLGSTNYIFRYFSCHHGAHQRPRHTLLRHHPATLLECSKLETLPKLDRGVQQGCQPPR